VDVFSVDALADWISGDFGDPELATVIREVCEGAPPFKVAGPAREAEAAVRA